MFFWLGGLGAFSSGPVMGANQDDSEEFQIWPRRNDSNRLNPTGMIYSRYTDHGSREGRYHSRNRSTDLQGNRPRGNRREDNRSRSSLTGAGMEITRAVFIEVSWEAGVQATGMETTGDVLLEVSLEVGVQATGTETTRAVLLKVRLILAVGKPGLSITILSIKSDVVTVTEVICLGRIYIMASLQEER